MSRPTKPKGISDTAFVREWMKAHKEDRSIQSVAANLGVTRSAVYARRNKLTDAGLELPQLVRKEINPVDVEGLQQIMKEEE